MRRVYNFKTLIIRQYFNISTYNSPKEIQIPRDQIEIKYCRSSGPGGQHVNTTNSKAVLRLNLDTSNFLSNKIIVRLKELYPNYISKTNELILSSQGEREQERNLNEAMKKLKEMIFEASIPKKERIFEEYQETYDQEFYRIDLKRKRSEIKSQRNKKLDF